MLVYESRRKLRADPAWETVDALLTSAVYRPPFTVIMHITYTCLSFAELSNEALYEVLALRQLVFIVEQNCPYLDCDGRDQSSWHLLGRDEAGALVSYTRILPLGVSYPDYASIGRVVSSPAIRRAGKGRELMQESIRCLYELFGRQAIKIGAQAYLRDFYGSLGFEPTGEAYLEDGIPHIGMVLRD